MNERKDENNLKMLFSPQAAQFCYQAKMSEDFWSEITKQVTEGYLWAVRTE